MSDDNLITVRGHAGTTPEIRVTRTDREFTQFRLGSSRRYLDVASGEWKDAESEWFTIKVWRPAQARNVCDSVRSGTPLLVQGHFSSEHWEADGTPRVTNVITAKVVAVDLANGRASYTKVRHEDMTEERSVRSETEQGGRESSRTSEVADPSQWEQTPATA